MDYIKKKNRRLVFQFLMQFQSEIHSWVVKINQNELYNSILCVKT